MNPLPPLPPGSGLIAVIMQIVLWLVRLRQRLDEWLRGTYDAASIDPTDLERPQRKPPRF